MTFRNRLFTGFISIVLMIGALSIANYSISKTIEQKLNNVVEDRYKKVRIAEHVLTDASQIQNLVNLSMLDTKQQLDDKELQALYAQVDRNFNQLDNLTVKTTGQEFLAKSKTSYRLYEKRVQAVEQVILSQSSTETVRVQSILNLEILRKTFVDDFQNYIAFQESLMVESSNEAMDSIADFRMIVLVFCAMVIVLTLLIGLSVLRGVTHSILRISNTMDSFDSEHTGALPRIKIETKDEINTIAHAYNRMAAALEERRSKEREYQHQLKIDNWVKTHMAEISVLYQHNRDVSSLCSKVLNKLIPLVDGTCATLYVIDRTQDQPLYTRKATYAWDSEASGQSAFSLGEGLVGQCAASAKTIEAKVPLDYVRVLSGIGSSAPTHLIFVPVPHNGEIIAVLELGSFEPISGRKQMLLMDIANNSLGTTIRNLQYQKHVEKLFAESQTFNEELQVQSEELLQQQEALRLLNERLEDQVKISESNSRYKSEFLANMSHELRTPLNSLLVLAQILRENKEGNLTPRQSEYADTMVSSGNQLLALINDILDLSKIEAGQMPVAEDRFELQELLDELSMQFRPMMEEKNLAFTVTAEPQVKKIAMVTDKQRLRQILSNLLSNALKFTSEGVVSLRITLEKDDPALLAFSVTDTGIGIPKEEHQSIFEAFRQLEGTTSRKYGGTGLGLAISQELAHLIGGRITLESAPQSGSTFTLIMPFRGDFREMLLQTAVAVYEDLPPLESVPTQAVSILLVDDDMRNIYSLSSVLEEYGYTVICATNGSEALDLLSSQEIDLILMDIMMPDMDGYEAMRQIRSSQKYIHVPIIALTAKAMKEDRDLCIQAGADDYISKPVRLDKLLSLIRVWLPGRHSHD